MRVVRCAQLLNRHVDQYDYEHGVALLEILSDGGNGAGFDGGQLQVDISESEASAAAASAVVSIVEIERRFGDPERYGTADIEPCAWVAADLKRRPHVVLKGHGRQRHSIIVQDHEC